MGSTVVGLSLGFSGLSGELPRSIEQLVMAIQGQ
jgi:hypothetical protein